MTSLANDFRKLFVKRLEAATLAEIWEFAQKVSANDAAPAPEAFQARPRFTKLDLRGNLVPDSETSWIAVYDAETHLTWTRDVLECGEVNWKDAQTAARNMRIFGKDDWRAPTVKEQLSIIDYARVGPAVDTSYFSKHTGWCWTSTVDAESPSDCAWLVYLHNGFVCRSFQTTHYSVRAVRAGQPLELGL